MAIKPPCLGCKSRHISCHVETPTKDSQPCEKWLAYLKEKNIEKNLKDAYKKENRASFRP